MLKENLLNNTHAVEQTMAQLGRKAAKLRGSLNDVVEDSIVSSRRAIRRSRDRAEDLLETASHNVRRHPLASVAGAFGLGALAGLLIVSLRHRSCSKS
jgi:ElaB/YqjD/DUF883 family membrane-anchored ribosome-binding protein